MARPNTTDAKVLDALKTLGGSATPTQIGLTIGYPHIAASSRVAPSLKRLVAAKVIDKRLVGDRKVTYEICQ